MKEKLIAHCEKGVFGMCVVLLLYFVYGAFSLKSYERKPEHFTQTISNAEKNVNSSSPDLSGTVIPDLKTDIKELDKPLDATPYQFTEVNRRAFNFGQMFRNEPAILKPGKAAVQANRGLVALWKTDLDGKRLKRKVKKSEARFAAGRGTPVTETQEFARKMMERELAGSGMMPGVATPAGGLPGSAAMVGMGPSSNMGSRGGRRRDREEGGMGRGMGMGPGMGPGGVGMGPGGVGTGPAGVGMGPAGMGMNSSAPGGMMSSTGMIGLAGRSSLMGGNDDMGRMIGMGQPVMGEDGVDVNTAVRANKQAVGDRKRRLIAPKDLVTGKATKKDAAKKAPKDEEEIEEYVETMRGKHWVEIVATFPHSDQIKEYVKALREPANFVGLRYFLADVQRRELQSDLTWSEWEPIPLKEQFSVVQNALAYEPERQPQVVMKGLCMNIPFLQTTYKELLTLEEFETPLQAEYTLEEMEPWRKQAVQQQARRISRAPRVIKKETKAVESKGPPTLPKSAPAAVVLSAPGDPTDKDKPIEEPTVFDNRFLVKNAMIRYWDFTVVPGKRYQYQLRVVAYNPNYKRADVADAAFAETPFLVGAWSDASAEVYVEPDREWYAVRPKRGNLAKTGIEVHYWDVEMGEWVTNELQHGVGDVVGVTGAQAKENKLVKWDDIERNWVVKRVSLKDQFDTKSILLDLEGGIIQERVGDTTTKLTLPREVITVNEFGDLIRRDSETDGNNSIREAIGKGYQELISEMEEKLSNPAAGAGIGAAGLPVDAALDPVSKPAAPKRVRDKDKD